MRVVDEERQRPLLCQRHHHQRQRVRNPERLIGPVPLLSGVPPSTAAAGAAGPVHSRSRLSDVNPGTSSSRATAHAGEPSSSPPRATRHAPRGRGRARRPPAVGRSCRSRPDPRAAKRRPHLPSTRLASALIAPSSRSRCSSTGNIPASDTRRQPSGGSPSSVQALNANVSRKWV